MWSLGYGMDRTSFLIMGRRFEKKKKEKKRHMENYLFAYSLGDCIYYHKKFRSKNWVLGKNNPLYIEFDMSVNLLRERRYSGGNWQRGLYLKFLGRKLRYREKHGHEWSHSLKVNSVSRAQKLKYYHFWRSEKF